MTDDEHDALVGRKLRLATTELKRQRERADYWERMARSAVRGAEAAIAGIRREHEADLRSLARPWDEPDDAIGLFDPPYDLVCPRCRGALVATVTRDGSAVILACTGKCRRAWRVPTGKP